MNRRQRRELRQERPGRRHPNHYTADQLHRMLVQDATDGLGPNSAPTLDDGMQYMTWCVLAYQRIGQLRRCGTDKAFEAVREEAEAKTGMGMPL